MSTEPGPLAFPSFAEALLIAAGTPELLQEYDRLTGSNLSRRGSPIDLMIDEASGRLDAEVERFAAFVREYIYEPARRAAEEARGA